MTNRTDEELDRDWKPNGRRPQSTIARSFSQELGDIFRIDNSLADLGEQVDKRKQNVVTQTSELSALENRIREMEAMLKRQQQGRPGIQTGESSAAGGSGSSPSRPLEHRQRQSQHSSSQSYAQQQRQQYQPEGHQKHSTSRPGSGRPNMPPTPVGSDDGDVER